MKKIVVASDSFKGSLTSEEVGLAVKEGVLKVHPDYEVVVVPVADGGEGTVKAIITAALNRGVENTHYINCKVQNPLGREIIAQYGVSGDTAYIEIAAASGVSLLAPKDRNPMITSSFGTGQLIVDALNRGYKKFVIGLGGSATVEAGTGMLSALGFHFVNDNQYPLTGKASSLRYVIGIDEAELNPALFDCEFTAAYDVDARFFGPRGAAYMFAPQKGATSKQVLPLDTNLKNFSNLLKKHTGIDPQNLPGAGAAGSAGGTMAALLNANMKKGTDVVFDAIGMSDIIEDADLVITGEGRMDAQTSMGKLPAGILDLASRFNVPVIGIAGRITHCPELDRMGFKELLQTTPLGMPVELAIRKDIAKRHISEAVTRYLEQNII